MWTAEHRRAADRRGLRYPSDLADDEWAVVSPLICPAKRGGRPRSVQVREVLSATPNAGTAVPQVPARLADGRVGLLDDLLGGGFVLLCHEAPPPGLPPWLHPVRLGTTLFSNGVLEAWLGGADAALIRPDHIVFGTGDPARLTAELAAMLAPTTARAAHHP
jgi:hypothetical protein